MCASKLIVQVREQHHAKSFSKFEDDHAKEHQEVGGATRIKVRQSLNGGEVGVRNWCVTSDVSVGAQLFCSPAKGRDLPRRSKLFFDAVVGRAEHAAICRCRISATLRTGPRTRMLLRAKIRFHRAHCPNNARRHRFLKFLDPRQEAVTFSASISAALRHLCAECCAVSTGMRRQSNLIQARIRDEQGECDNRDRPVPPLLAQGPSHG